MDAVKWSITGRCNLKCRHCYISAPFAKYGELTHVQCLDIISQLAECGVSRISLTGGEPFVRSDFWELVDEIINKKMIIEEILTNGILVTKDNLNKFIDRGIRPVFQMSFDGVGCHDWLRGREGAEKAVLKAFSLCAEYGFETKAAFVMHKKNSASLRESVNVVSKLGCSFLGVGMMCNTGEWKRRGYTEFTLTPSQFYEELLSYIPFYYEDQKPIALSLGGLYMSKAHDSSCLIAPLRCGLNEDVMSLCVCEHARNSLYISAEGRCLPCMPLATEESFNTRFPNLCETRLEKALTDSFYKRTVDLRYSEYLKHNPKCKNCKWERYCLSGCRGIAMEHTGDYLGKDDSVCTLLSGGFRDRAISLVKVISSEEKIIA